MNNDHCFLRYKVSCVISLKFLILTLLTSLLGRLNCLTKDLSQIFCPEPHLLAYCPKSLDEDPRKILPCIKLPFWLENPGILSYLH